MPTKNFIAVNKKNLIKKDFFNETPRDPQATGCQTGMSLK